MTEDRSIRGEGGRFAGSEGAGQTPPTPALASPLIHNDGRPADEQVSLDVMYERFLAIRDEESPMRGWFEQHQWHPDLSDTEGLSRRRIRRMAGTYRTFTPLPIHPWDIPIPPEVAGDAADAEASILTLNERSYPALKPLARLLLRTESIASSKTEGLQVEASSLARAEAMLEEGHKPRSETSVEILRNIQAMETAIEQASQDAPFTVSDLCAIHARLMEGARDAGTIRVEQNWIGRQDSPVGANFVPPPPERVPALLADLVAAINDDTLPPVLQAAVVHAQLETIHPFADGNGRTGRALIHVVWRRRELTPAYVPPISLVFSHDRERYIDGLTAFREGRVNNWFTYFSDAAHQAAARAQAYITQVQATQDDWRNRIRASLPDTPRRDAAVWALIDALPAHPALTSARASAALSRSTPAVNQAIDQLEQTGILKRVNRGARNRVWEVPDLIDLIRETEN